MILVRRFYFLILSFFLILHSDLLAWGFFAHRLINRSAVYCLPESMIRFYKINSVHIETHATDPDNRRYIDPEEAPRHYIDNDHYDHDTVPKGWTKAVLKYSEDSLMAHGIVPWHIQRMYYRLVNAFAAKDKKYILRVSADLGHYIADAHVPLHTTSNYNGQKTNQKGIHGFWESRLPELFSDNYDLFTGRAEYIENIAEFSWKIIHESYSMKDSVLLQEASLNDRYPASLKYTYEQRGGQEIRTYSFPYSREYSKSLNNMVERRMKAAIHAVASAWYSAWVDAGQPDLNSDEVMVISVDSVAVPGSVGKLPGHDE